MLCHIVTIFPEYFTGILKTGVLRIAQEKKILSISLINLRDFADNSYRTVDDYPYGGGSGMIMKPEPIFRAVAAIKEEESYIILTSPAGRRFDQNLARELSQKKHLIFISGRYKGVDERVKYLTNDEISIGDFILSGGEAACAVILEAVVRLLPGVVGDEESIVSDSFVSGILDAPHYTRPANYQGYEVPKILLSGDHEKIKRWRRKEALRRTLLRRPDLLKNAPLSPEDLRLLEEIKREEGKENQD
ncbi:MAG: tRNA (guanosine(37)-N1)-methyltransferase TrmD [candidate division WOR-3 bacterium]